jgi:catechol 2,3-dioxygenase-like lactoylglutathione lyase family enzyme
MMHPKIDQQVTFLYCRDLDETNLFFDELLGFKMVLDQGGCRIFQVCEDGFLGYCYRDGTTPNADGLVYTFVTEEVDEWYTYLKDRGVECEKAPEVNPMYNIYHFFFRDPNGYLMEVQKFLDPRWPGKAS